MDENSSEEENLGLQSANTKHIIIMGVFDTVITFIMKCNKAIETEGFDRCKGQTTSQGRS